MSAYVRGYLPYVGRIVPYPHIQRDSLIYPWQRHVPCQTYTYPPIEHSHDPTTLIVPAAQRNISRNTKCMQQARPPIEVHTIAGCTFELPAPVIKALELGASYGFRNRLQLDSAELQSENIIIMGEFRKRCCHADMK